MLGAGSAETAAGFLYGGGGSGGIDTSNALNLKEIFELANYKVNPAAWAYYNTGAGIGNRSIGTKRVGEQPLSNMPSSVKDVSGYKDVGVVVISRPGSEGSDIPFTTAEDPDKHFLELSQNELDLINFACNEAGFGKVILLLNTMQAVELAPVSDYDNLSIVWIGAAGEYGAQAIPSILNGDVNPSGRLVDTYVNDMLANDPSTKNQGDLRWTASDGSTGAYYVYQENIYVGYKYYETRYADKVMGTANVGTYDYNDVVTYPFGYGESYTEFSYSNFSINESRDDITATVTVTNTGSVAGKEVIQIYMQSPYTQYDKDNNIEKEAVQLVGFDKTAELAAGERETVSVTFPKEYMRVYDATGAKTYILDAGDYYFTVGKDAHDAINNILSKQGYTTANGMTADGDASLVGQVNQSRLDKTSYATGDNGEAITNQLADADINYYDSSFKYMTRKDWAGTFPTSTYQINITQKMLDDRVVEDPEEDTTLEMPTTGANNGLSLVSMMGLDYDHASWDLLLDQLTYDEMVGLLSARFSNAAVPSVQKPALIDSDGPAGITASLGVGAKGFGYSVEVLLSSTWNKDLALRQGELIGEDSLATLVAGWYAPACNIHRSAFSGRNFEYYSEDSVISGQFAGIVINGAQSKGVYCYLKHFAINDQETNRVQANTFLTEQTARQIYLRPFEIAIREYGSNALMYSMNDIGMKWIGHHTGIAKNILRGEWNYKGIALTDTQGNFATELNDMAIYNGLDMYLSSQTVDSSCENSATMVTALREAAHHVLYVTVNSNGMNGLTSNTKIVNIIPPWVICLIIANVVVICACIGGSFVNIKRTIKNRKEDKE